MTKICISALQFSVAVVFGRCSCTCVLIGSVSVWGFLFVTSAFIYILCETSSMLHTKCTYARRPKLRMYSFIELPVFKCMCVCMRACKHANVLPSSCQCASACVCVCMCACYVKWVMTNHVPVEGLQCVCCWEEHVGGYLVLGSFPFLRTFLLVLWSCVWFVPFKGTFWCEGLSIWDRDSATEVCVQAAPLNSSTAV